MIGTMITIGSMEASTGLSWIARTRVGGDAWDGEPVSADPQRYRVRVLNGETVIRVFETQGEETGYSAAQMAADFPGGIGPDAAVAVAQAGVRWDWGVEARASITV